ncbi:MAG: S41 family peptidase, partial [Firmicutes bacterium]|nr:S41 family peptidase [Bacillota bacterium]
MRHYFFFLVCFTSFQTICGQSIYQWPIKDATVGNNILFKPNDYIAGEHNYDNLIITAQENNPVVAPVCGKVKFYAYSYKKSLNSCVSYHLPISQYEADMDNLKSCNKWKYDTKYVYATLSIQTEDGNIINIEGMRPIKSFKTGEIINQGDIIGKVGYYYYKINKPCIAISISKQSKADDPMTPFGLKTTFKKAVSISPPAFLTQEEALKDYSLFVNAVQEGYPGLYDYMSPEEWQGFVNKSISKITNPISYLNFRNILINTLHQLRDSHLNLIYRSSSTISNVPKYTETIFPGVFNDTLMVVRAPVFNASFVGKKISKINGLTPQQYIDTITPLIVGYDGFIQSYLVREKLLWSWSYFNAVSDSGSKYDFYLCFGNDSVQFFPKKELSSKTCTPFVPNWGHFFLSAHQELRFDIFDKKEEKIAYIYLPTFYLNEMEILIISDFIKEINDSAYTSLIIDVRNNNGGDVERLKQIFSFIAQQPFKEAVYSKVNKTRHFSFLGNTTNYALDDYNIFPEYMSMKDKDGFIFTDYPLINPDSNINFKGKIYVLTNELSFSAAATFAALVHKHRRGVVVGRETGTTYYQ